MEAKKWFKLGRKNSTPDYEPPTLSKKDYEMAYAAASRVRAYVLENSQKEKAPKEKAPASTVSDEKVKSFEITPEAVATADGGGSNRGNKKLPASV